MSDGNGTLELPQYIECAGCVGRGLVKIRVDADMRLLYGIKDPAQKLVRVAHERCAGAGIMILRSTGRGGKPFYGRPKLS